jgi:AraC family transcriptional regulator
MSEIVTRSEPIRYVYLVHSGFYHQIGSAFKKVFEIVGKAGLIEPGYQSIGVYFDDPSVTPEDQLRSHAGFIVKTDSPIPEGLEVTEIVPGRSLVHRHLGSYATMMESWMTVWADLKDAPKGPCFEIYINDCSEVPEADLITDLHIPIA